MPSIDRPLSGEVMIIDLGGSPTEAPAERSTRTLLKTEGLTVTRVVLPPKGEIAEHSAPGAITVQVLEGEVRFVAAGREYDLSPGKLLYVDAGVRHRVSSQAGGTFLLTLGGRRSSAKG